MTVWAPCRLGRQFTATQTGHERPSRFYMTGMCFFEWSLPTWDNMTLYGQRFLDSKNEHTRFFHRKQLETEPDIQLEVPVEIIRPGYPLRELGLDTDAVGRLCAILWDPERGHAFRIGYGRSYGGPFKELRTEKLDAMFAALLPGGIRIDPMEYLM